MKQHSTFRFAQMLFIIFSLSMATSLFTGCKKDDDKTDECDNFVSLGGEATINGAKNSISVAQLLITSGGGFGDDVYGLQVGGFTSDCNVLQTFSLFINIPAGGKLNGTYSIVDFFDADTNDAHGSYTEQKISPISQSLEDLVSGSFKVTDKGSKLYSIDLTGKTVSGEDVSLKGDVQF